jgi:hypothetical protein
MISETCGTVLKPLRYLSISRLRLINGNGLVTDNKSIGLNKSPSDKKTFLRKRHNSQNLERVVLYRPHDYKHGKNFPAQKEVCNFFDLSDDDALNSLYDKQL